MSLFVYAYISYYLESVNTDFGTETREPRPIVIESKNTGAEEEDHPIENKAKKLLPKFAKGKKCSPVVGSSLYFKHLRVFPPQILRGIGSWLQFLNPRSKWNFQSRGALWCSIQYGIQKCTLYKNIDIGRNLGEASSARISIFQGSGKYFLLPWKVWPLPETNQYPTSWYIWSMGSGGKVQNVSWLLYFQNLCLCMVIIISHYATLQCSTAHQSLHHTTLYQITHFSSYHFSSHHSVSHNTMYITPDTTSHTCIYIILHHIDHTNLLHITISLLHITI